MKRSLLTLTACLFLAPAATASLGPRKGDNRLEQVAARRASDTAPAERSAPNLEITDKTEVRLDGQPCKFEAVPDKADVIFLEVASNKRTVLKIHFQTRK